MCLKMLKIIVKSHADVEKKNIYISPGGLTVQNEVFHLKNVCKPQVQSLQHQAICL